MPYIVLESKAGTDNSLFYSAPLFNDNEPGVMTFNSVDNAVEYVNLSTPHKLKWTMYKGPVVMGRGVYSSSFKTEYFIYYLTQPGDNE